MAKVKRKKIKFKVIPFLILCISLVCLYFLVTYMLDMKIKNIYIYDNNLLTDQQIIDEAKLNDYPSFFKTTSRIIKKRLMNNSLIKDVKIKKGILGDINIYVDEYDVLLINKSTNKMVLENYKEIDKVDVIVPTLLNSVPEEIYKELINSLKSIDKSILREISEIKYSPTQYDEKRFILNMKDSNTVYINIVKFDSINYYNDIYPTLNNKKGTLYLDSGNHFEIYK